MKIVIQIIKAFFVCLMSLISFIYPYKLSSKIKECKNYLYSFWIKRFLGCVGHGSRVSYPCILQGGGNKNIRIGHNTSIQGHVVLGCWTQYGDNQFFNPSIIIGSHCNIGEYNQITACNGITIGDGLLTGRFVYIGDNSHGGLTREEAPIPPVKRKLFSKGEIRIGNNVWIGDKVTILAGVTIGDNVIIGANSVVTHDLPNNCVAAGVPARVLKKL